MGQEIDRARALLSALSRERILPKQTAYEAYETWVAHGSADQPFSRYIIERGPADAESVRRLLRLTAVQGLPEPERYTFERFEDLLIGQLGIEAGMLSPKMLRAVRAVQDKKVREGKLRRLSDLLPRAGFDRELLELLKQHLQERVLLCAGCLGRYPRNDLSQTEADCPRCGERILADPLEPSGRIAVSDEHRAALMASSECVMETIPVSQREVGIRRTQATKTASSGPSKLQVLIVCAGLAALVWGVVFLLSQRQRPPVRVSGTRPRATPKPTPTPEATPVASATPQAAYSLADARARDVELLPAGKYAELLEVWRQVSPGPSEQAEEVQAAKTRRVAELERLRDLAAQAEALLAKVEADSDPQQEYRLARLLQDAPGGAPPFAGILGRLEARREARRAQLRARAAERVREAGGGGSSAHDPWPRRTTAAQRGGPLLGVELNGRRQDGVRIERIDAEGFELVSGEGPQQLSWSERPLLGLRLLERAVDAEAPPEDQLELLRRALLAGDPLMARAAMERLQPADPFDVAKLIAEAASSAPFVPGEQGALHLRYPLAWPAHDLVLDRGTTVDPAPESLTLRGRPSGLRSKLLPVVGQSAAGEPWVLVRCLIGESPEDACALGLVLASQTTQRTYLLRWSASSWNLELDLGTGSNPLGEGELSAQAGRRAEVEYTGREVVFRLDGVELARTPARARLQSAGLRFQAGAGPVAVEELLVAASVDPEWLENERRQYVSRVQRKLDALLPASAISDFRFPALSVEDPLAQANVPEAQLEALETARAPLLDGRRDVAAAKLRDLCAAQPQLLAARYYRAYAAILQDDPGIAQLELSRALIADPEFVEARALLGMLLANAGRLEPANRLLGEVERVRPDLPAVHLGRAHAAFQARAVELGDPAALERSLTLAEALGAGDPLVSDQVGVLRDGLRLERSLGERYQTLEHFVLTPDDAAQARAVGELLDPITKLVTKRIGTVKGDPIYPVAVLPPAEYELQAGNSDDAHFDRARCLLLLRGPPRKLSRSIIVETARNCLARRYGWIPPWLEIGLAEYLARDRLRQSPEDYVELLKSTRGASAGEWQELFELEAEACAANVLARARSWVLVEATGARKFRVILGKTREGTSTETFLPGVEPDALQTTVGRFLAKLRN